MDTHNLVKWTRTSVFLILFYSVAGDFNCRRKGFSCQDGSTCSSNGTCICPPNRAGYDCSIDTALVGCDKNECKNDGICYDNGKCSCSPDTYGEKCQYKTVSSECLGTELKMAFAAPQSFSGEVYASRDEANCKFIEADAEVPGWKKYTLSIPFDGDSVCTSIVNQTSDEPWTGDVNRYVDVVVSYNPMFISNTDRVILYSCVHKGSNFTMFAELDDVSLNERTNLKKDVHAVTYSPVKFVVLDKDGKPLEKSLFVGDMFKLLFFLGDTTVYESLRIDYCIANNTMSEKPIRFEFVKDGCPTEEGKNILVNQLDGPTATKYTRPDDSVQLPASELLMYAFKFKGTTNVGFNCAVQICKKGDESLCQPRKCSSTGLPTENIIQTNTTLAAALTTTASNVPENRTSVVALTTKPAATERSPTLVITTTGSSGERSPSLAITTTGSSGQRSPSLVVTTTGSSGESSPALVTEATTQNAPEVTTSDTSSTNETSLRRKRSSKYGDRQFLSAIVTVQEPNLDELLILPNIKNDKKNNNDNNRSQHREQTGECVMSQDIIIVIIVMATVIFVFIVLLSLLITLWLNNRRKVRMLKEKQRLEYNYTIPRPHFEKK